MKKKKWKYFRNNQAKLQKTVLNEAIFPLNFRSVLAPLYRSTFCFHFSLCFPLNKCALQFNYYFNLN